MKRLSPFIVSLLFFTPFIAYSQDEDSIPFEHYFEPGVEQLLDGSMLSGSMKIQHNSSGDLYLLDLRQNKVFVYDKDLKEKFSFGQKGKGPGEFENSTDIYIDEDDNVYIIDSALLRVSQFSSYGDFIGSNAFDFRAIDMITAGEVICLHTGGVVPKDQQTVKCYDVNSGKFQKSLIGKSKVVGNRPVGFANATFDMIQKNEDWIIVLQHPTDATISIFNNKLELQNTLIAENEIFEQPEYPANFSPIEHKIADFSQSSINGIYLYDDIIFVLFIEFGTGQKFLDMYNTRGERLIDSVIKLDKRWPKYVDQEGNLYSFSYFDDQKEKLNLKVYKKK